MSDLSMAGSNVRPLGRAPRKSSRGRVCTEPECQTRLSMYNRNDTCFRHSPTRYPRVRGRIKRD